jgi:hypothetical protein
MVLRGSTETLRVSESWVDYTGRSSLVREGAARANQHLNTRLHDCRHRFGTQHSKVTYAYNFPSIRFPET